MHKDRDYLWKGIAFILIAMICACKAPEKLVDKKPELLKLISILKQYREKNQIKAKSISLKGKIQLLSKGKDYRVNAKMRIEKGEKIWVSASFLGFEVGRALIQPHQTEAYEKLQRTFLKGDFSLAGKYLKAYFFNYSQLENLLLGRSLFQIDAENYALSMSENIYKLRSTSSKLTTNSGDQVKGYTDKLEIDGNFHLKKEIIKLSDGEKISVFFENWEKVNEEYFPGTLRVFVNDQIQPILSVDLQEIKIDGSMPDISFSIPEGYTERQL
ncbi:DUF4292 domain-containing protein [Bacteroidetes bacterium endosymbiont of Geopemphigus sp.]|uniref:DUF4292 domain-containing protein n=1 Tax=Bacteroidetes bacterium endosymbiont of Geopemphigus sp. TaxID=2047937 RepID=UPI0011AF684F|nr:DUF4292 domain-containing protein [Bacteroidetes bacterium endosymbiont of Geopemphigus sp.]